MTDVKGYRQLSDTDKALANEGKEMEECYLRWLDRLSQMKTASGVLACDGRSLALARTHIETGAMWAIRAIFAPQRIKLPGETP